MGFNISTPFDAALVIHYCYIGVSSKYWYKQYACQIDPNKMKNYLDGFYHGKKTSQFIVIKVVVTIVAPGRPMDTFHDGFRYCLEIMFLTLNRFHPRLLIILWVCTRVDETAMWGIVLCKWKIYIQRYIRCNVAIIMWRGRHTINKSIMTRKEEIRMSVMKTNEYKYEYNEQTQL